MRKFALVFVSVVFLSVYGVSTAQPVPSMDAPAAAPVAMSVDSDSRQPVTAESTESATTTAMSAPSSPDAPVWKSPNFWVGIGGTVLGVILTILVAFGVIRKKHLDYLKEKEIIKIADKVVSGFEGHASGSSAKWDDILAMALRAVVDRVGELTEDQENVVKKVVENRKEQAKTKEKLSSSNDKTEDDVEEDK